ncbi:MAG TPA: glycosyltransferase family 1 protein [Ilumatobacter sp.]|nr:glycosyltransferase family 1 protein [Ilumatobacter sp.]
MKVALDVGPLYGARTGVGAAVAGLHAALAASTDVELDPYLVSNRSMPQPGHRKLPLPGIVGAHAWARGNHPHAGRWMPGVDVVHGTNYVAPPTGLPTVVSVYDCWFLAHPEQAAALVKLAGRVLRRRVAEGAWVHTGSAAISAEAARLLGTDRVVTVPLGPPPAVPELDELSRPAVADAIDGRPFVLAVGTQERRKDLGLLVRAFAELAPRQPDALLVLVGSAGDDSASVAAAVDELPAPVAARVLQVGFVDEPAKHWLLRSAAAVAYPSRDEGFGFPVLEGHAAGTPVVAYPVGSLPEVGGDAVEFVAERTPDALATAIEHVLTDTARRLELIGAGYRNVARFDWHHTATGLADLYRKALR